MPKPKRPRVDFGSTCFERANRGPPREFLYGCDAEPGEVAARRSKKLMVDEFAWRRFQSRASIRLVVARRLLPGEHMTFVAGYVVTLVAFVAADMVWLGTMIERVYRPAIGNILSTSVNLPAAIVFYLSFPVGLTIFAVLPAAQNQSAGHAALFGGLFGFFAYATYDLTNQATLRNWPTHLTVIDRAWGSALAAFAATIGYLAASRF